MKTNRPAILSRSIHHAAALSFAAAVAAAFAGAPSASAQSGAFTISGNLGTGNSDALVGLSTTKTYLDAYNLGDPVTDPAVTVNGVLFTNAVGATNAGNPFVTGVFSTSGLGNVYTAGGTIPGGSLGTLMNKFVYGGTTVPEVFTYSNLVIGQSYVVTFYNRSWDASGTRVQNLSAGGASTGTVNFYDEDSAPGQGNLNLVRYTFQAASTTQTISFVAAVTNFTDHQYAFTLEQTFNNSWAAGANWTTSTWTGGAAVAPNLAGSNAFFTAQGAPTAIDLDANRTVGHIQFDGANAWSVNSAGGNTLTLQADVGGAATLSALAGSHTIAPNITLSSPTLLKVGAGAITLNGNITAGASTVEVGGGTLTLAGTNTYTGVTVIGSGTLEVKSVSDYGVASAIGSRALAQENTTITGVGLHFQGGTLKFTGSTAQSTNRNIRMLNGTAGATIDASGANPAATLSFTHTGANMNLFDTGGTRTLTLKGTNTGANSFAIRLENQGGSATSLTKDGAGKWVLTATDSTFTGGVNVNAGDLWITNTNALGTGTKTITLTNGTAGNPALHLDGSGGAINLPATFSFSTSNTSTATSASVVNEAGNNTVGGNFTLTVGGGGTRLLSNAGKVTFTGGFSPNTTGRELYLRGNGDGENSGVIADGSTVNMPVFKDSGSGTWTLSNAANTYTGPTTISAGTLAVATLANGSAPSNIGASGSAAANLVFGNGTLRYTGAGVVTDRAFTINAGATGAIEVSNIASTLTFAGATGAATNGALTKSGAGTLILSGINTYTGTTTVGTGTLRVNGSLDAGSAVAIANGATLGGTGTVGGSITTVAGAHLAPGASVGTLTAGSVALVPNAILDFEFNGGPNNDQLIISNAGGLAINGGGFNLYAEGGTAAWTTNGTYTLLDYNTSFTGAAGNLTILNAQAGKYYSITDDNGAATAIKLTIADATQSEWQANPGDSQWTTGGNWIGGTPNSGGVVAKFGTIPNAATPVAVSGAKIVGGIIFDNANGYTVSGGAGDAITLDNGVASASIAVASGTHTLNAPLTLLGNLSATAASGTSLTLGGAISGAAKNLIVTGLGTVTLAGANAYGLTTVTNATLQIGAGGITGNLGSGDVTMSGGATLVFNRSDDLSVANNLLGTNTTLTKLGAGKLTLTGANTTGGGVTGLVNINAGTLQLGSAGALPSGVNLALASGTLDFNANNLTANALTGAGGLVTDNSGTAGTTVFTLNQTGSATYGGSIANGATRALSFVLGSGALTLTGTLGANATVAGGATLALDRATDATLATTLGGTTGTFTKLGAGTLTLTGVNTIATLGGGVNINAGALKVGNATALPAGVLLALGGGTLDLNANSIAAGSFGGTAGLVTDSGVTPGTSLLSVNQSGTTTYSGTIADGATRLVGLAKLGAGTLTLAGSAANTYTGGTSVTGGVLLLQKTGVNAVAGDIVIGDAIGSDVVLLGASNQIPDSAVLTFTAGGSGNSAFFHLNTFNETVRGIQTTVGNAAVIANAAASGTSTLNVDTAGNSYTYDGIIRNGGAGAMALTKSGNGTLTVANTAFVAQTNYSGATLINAGKLVFENNGGTMPTAITNNSTTPDALTFNQVLRGVIVSGAIGGSGGLTKLGTNGLTLTATNSYAGLTTISGGTLTAAAAGGTALPGNVLFGNGTQAGIFLVMGAANQFGANSVLTFNNGPGFDTKLELRGFAQTVAGIQSDADDTLSIIQNQETGAPASTTLTINNAADYVFNGLIRTQIGGVLNLVKSGAGTQEIRNIPAQADNFGTLAINEGKFTINFSGGTGTLGAGTTVSVASIGTLGLDGTWTMDRVVSGAGKVLKQGAGTVAVTAANGYLGGTTITGGTLNVNADAALGDAAGTVALSNGAVLQAGGALTMNRAFTLGTGGGTIDTNGSTVTLGATSAIGGTALTKTGSGLLNLSGPQTYAALTTSGGTTSVNTTLGSGTSTVTANATVNFYASQTLASLTIADGVEVTFGDSLPFAGGPEKSGAPALVPEPGALGLLLVGALGVLVRRRP